MAVPRDFTPRVFFATAFVLAAGFARTDFFLAGPFLVVLALAELFDLVRFFDLVWVLVFFLVAMGAV